MSGFGKNILKARGLTKILAAITRFLSAGFHAGEVHDATTSSPKSVVFRLMEISRCDSHGAQTRTFFRQMWRKRDGRIEVNWKLQGVAIFPRNALCVQDSRTTPRETVRAALAIFGSSRPISKPELEVPSQILDSSGEGSNQVPIETVHVFRRPVVKKSPRESGSLRIFTISKLTGLVGCPRLEDFCLLTETLSRGSLDIKSFLESVRCWAPKCGFRAVSKRMERRVERGPSTSGVLR